MVWPLNYNNKKYLKIIYIYLTSIIYIYVLDRNIFKYFAL